MELNKKQQRLMEVAKKRGYITDEDFNAEYASVISRKANLERFLALGLLKEENNKYVFVDDGLDDDLIPYVKGFIKGTETAKEKIEEDETNERTTNE